MTAKYVVLEDTDSLYIDDGEAQDKIKRIFELRKRQSADRSECEKLVGEVKEYPDKYINKLGESITKYHSDEFNVELKSRKKAMALIDFRKQLILLLPKEYIEVIDLAEENAKSESGTTVQCSIEKL